jgi:hypothetical protein
MPKSLTQWISTNRHLTALCAVVISIAAFYVAITPRMIEARGAIERKIEEDIAQESRIACEKWGMLATTLAHISCVADLAAIRKKHDDRRADDTGL